MNLNVIFSSKTDDWATPQNFFDELDNEFGFQLDPCADDLNHKCKKYYTKECDGLKMDWGGYRVYCNPPYGREISKWVAKCFETNNKYGNLIVALLPARTDTKWFHDYIYKKEGVYIRFVKGRLKFGNSKENAPFPSMVVIWSERSVV